MFRLLLNRMAVGAALAAALLSGAPQSAFAQRPSPDWDLHEQSESCYISRDFETSGGQINFLIQSYGPTSPYHFVLRGKAIPIRDERAAMASVGFEGEASAKDNLVLIGGTKQNPTAVFLAAPSSHSDIAVAIRFFSKIGGNYVLGQSLDPNAGQTLFVRFSEGGPLSIPLGDISGELAQPDKCAAAIDARWRSAVQGTEPAVAPKIIDPEGFLFRLTYPQALLINRFASIVEVRMTVGTDGRARDCVVRNSTWQKLFGKDTCKNYEQWARFEPARDAQGDSITGTYSTAASYIIFDW